MSVELKLLFTGESEAKYRKLAKRFATREEMFRTVFAISELLYGILDSGGEIFARLPDGEERQVELRPKERQ